MNPMKLFLIVLVLSVLGCAKKDAPKPEDVVVADEVEPACPTCPPQVECPPPVACPPQVECPPVPECPTCAVGPDAIGATLFLRATRATGPEMFIQLLFVHYPDGRGWQKVLSADPSEMKGELGVVGDEFLGHGALRRLEQYPDVVGQHVVFDGSKDYICHQRHSQIGCWMLGDGDAPGDRLMLLQVFRKL